VTGGGRGIGREIARGLAREGARVIVVSRTAAEIEETVALIKEQGGEAGFMVVDVSQAGEVEYMASEVHKKYGRIDILVNNAGIQGPIGSLVQNDVELWSRTISVNLIGTFLAVRAVLPFMIAQGRGKIINLSGGGSTGARPNFSAYAASKAAIVRLTETVAEEVKSCNIQVNAVAPGAINTKMLDDVLAAGALAGKEFEAALKQKKAGGSSPVAAAALVTFLASDDSGNLSGKLISALHDGWEKWDRDEIKSMQDSSWLNLRRIDEFTLRPVLDRLK
jgi:NAD(P)-dependent dehydrogenase (short-subunit alcohol dehydrogenase family)